jgi:hypothetical protein
MRTYLHVTPWGYYWLAVAVLLAGPEIYWAFVNSANTISDNVWAVEHVNLSHPFDFADWTWLHYTISAVVWSLFLWLSLHIPFGLLSP